MSSRAPRTNIFYIYVYVGAGERRGQMLYKENSNDFSVSIYQNLISVYTFVNCIVEAYCYLYSSRWLEPLAFFVQFITWNCILYEFIRREWLNETDSFSFDVFIFRIELFFQCTIRIPHAQKIIIFEIVQLCEIVN